MVFRSLQSKYLKKVLHYGTKCYSIKLILRTKCGYLKPSGLYVLLGKQGIKDKQLIEAIKEIEDGLNDGDLGGGLIKKRVAQSGQGKRGSFRTIIVYRSKIRSVFVFAFPKNKKANLSPEELEAYKELAGLLLSYKDEEIAKALREGELKEVNYGEKEISE